MSDLADDLRRRIADRTAKIGVIGMGYVGLPLAVEFASVGFTVTGIDVDPEKIDTIRSGRSHIEDVPTEVVGPLVRKRLPLQDPPNPVS